jgi:hypothetical protein
MELSSHDLTRVQQDLAETLELAPTPATVALAELPEPVAMVSIFMISPTSSNRIAASLPGSAKR